MEMTVPNILSLAKFSEYITTAKIGSHNAMQGGDINEQWARIIYMERVGIQNRYNLNPSDPTLQGTANYLFSILRYISQAITIKGNLSGSLPVITGPANESTTVGASATFTVSVTSATPVVIQWLLGGVPTGIFGPTLTVSNAQLSQSGNLYSAMATNLAGTVTSNQATLTVTAGEVAYYYQGTTDYSTQLLAGTDNVPYLGTVPVTTGQPITVTYPNEVNTQFIVLKYPATEPTKTSYLNPPPSGPDTGPIPNIALEGTTIGSWKYVFSRNGNPFALNNINGQVKFS